MAKTNIIVPEGVQTDYTSVIVSYSNGIDSTGALYWALKEFSKEKIFLLYCIDNAEPFIVQVNHSGAKSDYCNSMNEPLKVITSKYGFGIVEPYMVQIGQTGFAADRSKDIREPLTTIVSKNEHCLISPTLIQYHSETVAGEVRGQTITDPIMTVDGSNRYGLVTSFLSKFYKTGTGQDIREPLGTVTAAAGGGHFGEVRAFFVKYYSQGTGQEVTEPLDTIPTHERTPNLKIKETNTGQLKFA